MPLWSLVLGLVAQATTPAPWPIEILEPEAPEQVDLDQDGVLDLRVRGSSGGSGWREFDTCVRHGASGHVACERSASTAYARFSGQQRVLLPAEGNRAAALLRPDDCAAADPNDPAQGALWALRSPVPLHGTVAPTAAWLPGRPRDQASVCLSPTEAATLSGGLTWAQTEEGSSALAAEGWLVRYSASWPLWLGPGEPRQRTPRRIGTVGPLELYQHGAALALYDPAADRHAWLVNLAGDYGDGFKADRWERIQAVTARGPTVVEVQVNDGGDEEPLQLDLGLLLGRSPAPQRP